MNNIESILNRKTITIVVFFLAAVGVSWYLYTVFTTATISISATNNADIYVKQTEESFKKIGTSQAQYKTRDSETIFIEARKDDQISQTSVKPQQNKTLEISLDLSSQVKFRSLVKLAFLYPFFENNILYGINPNTNSLHSFNQRTNQISPVFTTLPFLKQVVWQDSNNFLYVTLGKGTGAVKNGTTSGNNTFAFSSAASLSNTSTALLGSAGVYLAKNFEFSTAQKIATTANNSLPGIFSSDSTLYFISLILEPGEEGLVPVPKDTNIQILNINGKKTHENTLPLKSPISKVIKQNDKSIIMLARNELILYDVSTKSTSTKQFSFGSVDDMVLYQGNIILMGSDGLWRYNTSSQQFSRLAQYPSGERYVINSLVTQDNDIFFSTTVTNQGAENNQSSATNNFYQLEFSNN